MIRTVSALCAALVFVAAAGAQENPFKKAKVGDWIEYKTQNSLMQGAGPGGAGGMGMKMTVTAMSAKEATLKVEVKVGGKAVPNAPGQEVKVPLDQEFDPTKLTSQGKAGANAKTEKLGEGDETITVNGKKLACKWMEMKTTTTAGGQDVEAKSKIWLAKEGVPLGGMVKMESDVKSPIAMKLTMEATGWGKGK